MLTNDELQTALANRPAPRVTRETIEARIAEVKFHRLGPTLTHCCIHVDNGYIATGESACVSPENYDKAIGEKLAYDQAFNKLWPLFGFLLAESRLRAERA